MKKLLVIALAFGLFLGGCAGGNGGTEDRSLIIYTNSASDGRGDWLTDLAEEAGFEIKVVHMGGGELTNRLIAEKNTQIADLVWGLNAVEYERLKKQDLLQKYEPTWAKEVDMVLGDPEGYYYPIVVQPLMMAYNLEVFANEEPPKDWTELGSKFAGRYQIHPLTGGTSRSVLASILVRYKDPNGELGISQEGWDVVKEYVQNAYFIQTNEDYWSRVIDGTRPMTMIWGSGLILNQNNLGQKFGIMQPEVGVPFVVEQLAIFKNSKKNALAIEFINWMGSAEIQAKFAQEFGTTPAHPDALAEAPQDIKDLMASVSPQDIDWKFVAENIDSWVEKVELEFRN
ncbi:MAG TPA: iron ABC transporter substrate-binding protein [Erysipelotrichaceae bacterium]|nr:iron ABC transporter substrate-binding protein [Erysipelotrichaceae bacterium]